MNPKVEVLLEELINEIIDIEAHKDEMTNGDYQGCLEAQLKIAHDKIVKLI